MPHIKIKENEPFDVALRRFKRSCEKAGVLAEVRKREHYEKPTTVRKRAGAAAVNPRIAHGEGQKRALSGFRAGRSRGRMQSIHATPRATAPRLAHERANSPD